MAFLDDERLRYPIEYINLQGATISDLKKIEGKSDLWSCRITSHLGFSIDCQAREDLVGELKEGTIKEGNVEGIIKYTVPENKDLSDARIFLTIEDWENVKIE